MLCSAAWEFFYPHSEWGLPMIRYAFLAAALAACCAGNAIAASAPRAQPNSWSGGFSSADTIETRTFDALDLHQIATEDASREAAGRPHRFAIPHQVAIDATSAGSWEQHGERSVWRYRVKATSAASLNFGFTHYHVPPSAKLFIYDASHRQVAGPYGTEHNEPHRQLWTPVIASDDVFIELDVASAERASVELTLGRINQGYRGLGTTSKGYHQPDLGQSKIGAKTCSPDQIASGTCNMDVACLDANDPWNKPRHSVGAITLNGSDDCTGSLVNNTANDRRMLFITASHCGLNASSSPTVVVYWNYEWPTCRTPGSAASGQTNPPDPSMTNSGATYLANTPNPFTSTTCPPGIASQCSDNTLVVLDTPANPDFNLFWEGWDRRITAAVCQQSADPTSTVGLCAGIHHPNVNEKRITFAARNFEVGGIGNGTNTHWHSYWDPTPPILPNIPPPQPPSVPPGVTEPGSSGSPLYTSEQRLIGVLSGGPSACGATGENLSDFYGQLALAWEGQGTPTTRLKDYLDPLGSAPQFIDGIGLSPFALALNPTSVAVCASAGSSAIQVDVSADAGFTNPVALSASGAPTGSTTSFAPTSVTPPGASTLTVGALASATPGSYTMTITGTSGADSASKSLDFTLNDVAPGAVSPISPANNATAVSVSPVLTWSAASAGGPQDYLVEVASDAAFATIVFTQTVHDATTVTVTPPLASSTTYYWRVTASNACGSATASPVFHFKTLGAPGVCEPPATPHSVFLDDVEQGANGWTTTGSTGASTWTISTARANSPTHAWYANDIATVSDQRLISPTIALPGSENPITLQFQNWREIEAFSGGCYDGGILEVSTDGSIFTQVPDSAIFAGGGYTGTVSDQFGNPLQGLLAWCGNTPRPFTAGPVRVDVSNYAGQNVQFRFRLGTDSSTSHEGWYVDDISVSSCSAGNDVIFADGFDGP
jgi:lysyl endopeptidase